MRTPRFARRSNGADLYLLPPVDVVEVTGPAATALGPEPYPWPPADPDDLPDESDDIDEALGQVDSLAEPDDETEDEPTPPAAQAETDDGHHGLGLPAIPKVELPPWVRQPGKTVAWARVFVREWFKFRAASLGPDLFRLVSYSPRGLLLAITSLYGWATDAETKPLQHAAIERRSTPEWLAVKRQHKETMKTRSVVAVVSVLAVIGLVFAGLAADGLWPATTVLVVVIGLGLYGKPADKPVLSPTRITEPGIQRPTPDMITRAFQSAGLSKPDEPIEFKAPGIALDGDGWTATIVLPYGAKASTALARREAIAAGLDVDENRVFLERVRGDRGSARRVVLWLANKDPWAQRPVVSPLVKAERFSLWDPIPFAIDARGRQVSLPLVWSSLLVGARPRMGKTYAGRPVGAASVLDPYTRNIIWDGKGGKDWKRFETVAFWYGSGIRDSVMASLVQVLRDARADMDRRYEVMAELPDDVCPENKVTPAICRNRRLGMPLTMITLDEVQRALEHPEYGAEILDHLVELAKVGPAAGIILVLLTQKPDSKVIPDSLRGQIGTRFALRVATWQASDTILGAGSYKAGLDASKLLASAKGTGVLLGADDGELAEHGARTVRTYLLSNPDLRKIIDRARQLRIDAGTLEGMAAGEAVIPEIPTVHLLEDVEATFLPGEDKAWSETICARLAEQNPAAYDGWTPTALAASLRPYGIETDQLWGTTPTGKGANRRGITRDQVLDALAERANQPAPAT